MSTPNEDVKKESGTPKSELEDVTGISTKTAEALEKSGVTKVEDLKQMHRESTSPEEFRDKVKDAAPGVQVHYNPIRMDVSARVAKDDVRNAMENLERGLEKININK